MMGRDAFGRWPVVVPIPRCTCGAGYAWVAIEDAEAAPEPAPHVLGRQLAYWAEVGAPESGYLLWCRSCDEVGVLEVEEIPR